MCVEMEDRRELARRVLDLPLIESGRGDPHGAFTVRGYLMKILHAMWDDPAGNVTSKRPLKLRPRWRHDIYIGLIEAGLVDGALDEDGYLDEFTDEARERADHLVHLAIQELGRSS